jgi:tetratricopeptide (TPR) repeat protein
VLAWINLGAALSRTDDKEGAIKAFKRAIELDPKNGETHFNLAVVYRMQKKNDEAIPEYQEAVRLDPTLSGAWYDLGLLLTQDRRYDEALVAFKKYLATTGQHDPASEKDAQERIKSLEAASGKKR